MAPEQMTDRIHKRILFSREDDITAQVYLPKKPKKALLAFIMNISEGGVGLLINRGNIKKLKEGDTIILKMLMTPKPLDTIDYAEVEVKHILMDERLEFATLSCQFSGLSEDYLRKIRQFVHYILNEIGSQIYKKSFSLDYK